MTEIADANEFSTAAATGLIEALIKSDHVTRGHDTKDRRKIYVRLTEKGNTVVMEYRAFELHKVQKAITIMRRVHRDPGTLDPEESHAVAEIGRYGWNLSASQGRDQSECIRECALTVWANALAFFELRQKNGNVKLRPPGPVIMETGSEKIDWKP